VSANSTGEGVQPCLAGRLLRLATLQRQACLEAMPALRAAFAHTAAALAVLSAAIRRHPDPAQVVDTCCNCRVLDNRC
jgi:hypothetical protein